jgi:hypothetical protein
MVGRIVFGIARWSGPPGNGHPIRAESRRFHADPTARYFDRKPISHAGFPGCHSTAFI